MVISTPSHLIDEMLDVDAACIDHGLIVIYPCRTPGVCESAVVVVRRPARIIGPILAAAQLRLDKRKGPEGMRHGEVLIKNP